MSGRELRRQLSAQRKHASYRVRVRKALEGRRDLLIECIDQAHAEKVARQANKGRKRPRAKVEIVLAGTDFRARVQRTIEQNREALDLLAK